ncbi:hypothetical protein [Mesorhizobium xinjiangense]|uniref:hypothetical protein n=1 Tax=Mesorhizobium xinjiangense TaxID=2678685 RepID=UPI0012ED6A66|nr:hypothetical protein [Mesorhizobium xinjiangense]
MSYIHLAMSLLNDILHRIKTAAPPSRGKTFRADHLRPANSRRPEIDRRRSAKPNELAPVRTAIDGTLKRNRFSSKDLFAAAPPGTAHIAAALALQSIDVQRIGETGERHVRSSTQTGQS